MMTISESQAVAHVLRAAAGDTNVSVENLQAAFQYLNERAAKALQLGYIVGDAHDLDAAAHRIAQHNQDAR